MSEPAKSVFNPAGTGYRKAGIMPVSRGTRTETIIIFVTDVWSDLVNLFHDPLAYLKGQQFIFDQLSDEYIEWDLLAPITLTLKCGGNYPFHAQKTANILRDHDVIWQNLCDKGFGKNPCPSASDLADAMQGVFHVEIATYTSFAEVVYYPPNAPVNDNDPIAYKNDFTSPIYLSAEGLSLGTLHVDLDPSPRARAQLVASIAQDPDFLIRRFKQLTFEHQESELVRPTKAIPFPTDLPAFKFVDDELVLPSTDKYSKHFDYTVTGASAVNPGAAFCMQCVASGTVPTIARPNVSPDDLPPVGVVISPTPTSSTVPATAVVSVPSTSPSPAIPAPPAPPAKTQLTLLQGTLVTYNHAASQPSKVLLDTLIDYGVPMTTPPANAVKLIAARTAARAAVAAVSGAGSSAGSGVTVPVGNTTGAASTTATPGA